MRMFALLTGLMQVDGLLQAPSGVARGALPPTMTISALSSPRTRAVGNMTTARMCLKLARLPTDSPTTTFTPSNPSLRVSI